MFKIGKADNVIARIIQLNRHWGEFDLGMSIEIVCDTASVMQMEKILHNVFSDKKLLLDEQKDGYTEWFDISCFDDVVHMAEQIRVHKPGIKTIKKGIVIPKKTVVDIKSKKEVKIKRERRKEEKIALTIKENVENAQFISDIFLRYSDQILYFRAPKQKDGIIVFYTKKPNGEGDDEMVEHLKQCMVRGKFYYYHGGLSVIGGIYCDCKIGIMGIVLQDFLFEDEKFRMGKSEKKCIADACFVLDVMFEKISSLIKGKLQITEYNLCLKQIKKDASRLMLGISKEKLERRKVAIEE